MAHRGTRSINAITRRAEARIEKFNHTFRDYKLAETVCILSFSRILTHYNPKHKPVKEKVLVEHGEILADSRGRGSFQTTMWR